MARPTSSTDIVSPRIFMDPVHGSIELEPYLVAIIDTPEFQRLRKIKQLGGKCYVYPGATHTRFEHSIGVCHIAGELIKELNKDPNRPADDPWISDEEKVCIKIAALCHDIGHGPYSHVYDSAIKTCGIEGERKDHEYRSAYIVDKILMRKEVRDRFKKIKDTKKMASSSDDDYKKHIILIKKMITFSNDCKKYACVNDKFLKPEDWPWELITDQGKDKSYLFEIVANGFTGIDVDKMDYFLRDSRSVGLSNTFDWRRYTLTAKIIPRCPDGYTHICSRDKDAPALYELFHTRIVLHRTVYQHKTALLIEYMIKQAMIEASEVITYKDTAKLNPLECWKFEEFDKFRNSFLELTDDTVEQLVKGDISEQRSVWEISDATKLVKAQDWLKKIKTRQLDYKYLGSTKEGEKAQKFKLKAKDMNIDTEEDLIPEPAKFDYGKRNENPMELYFFYDKSNSGSSKKISKEEVSVFLPEYFKETKVFWYLNVTKYDDKTVSDLKGILNSDEFRTL